MENLSLPNAIGQLAVQYSDRPALKALMKLVPGWTAADTLLQKRADEIKEDRLSAFFEELAQGKHEISDSLIQSESFLHSYFCTVRAVLNCQQREKIKNFARLLDSSFDPASQVSSDEHEELLMTLDDITPREFAILCSLRSYELSNPKGEQENTLQNAKRYWGGFRMATIKTHAVPEESFNAYMARLERTGLYLRITGAFLDYSGDVGTTTPLLVRLIHLVSKRID